MVNTPKTRAPFYSRLLSFISIRSFSFLVIMVRRRVWVQKRPGIICACHLCGFGRDPLEARKNLDIETGRLRAAVGRTLSNAWSDKEDVHVPASLISSSTGVSTAHLNQLKTVNCRLFGDFNKAPKKTNFPYTSSHGEL